MKTTADTALRLYATDASVYEQIPGGVSLPGGMEDCIALVREAGLKSVSLICRGGGTSIAGQCVGEGIVVDFSRHMAKILSEPAEGTIRVQPGVVLDDLNDYLRPFGWQFPIDISTSSRCTIGGMVGNNAAGSHSIVYGTTRENVLETEVVLADGSVTCFGPLDEQALRQKLQAVGLEGDLYRTVYEVVDRHRDAILAAYPDPSVIRRNTGYALDMLAQGQPWVKGGRPFNLSQLICGSEGTLALVTAIKLKLSRRVSGKALACIHFDSLDAAFRANIRLLEQEGIGSCELIDALVLKAASGHAGQRSNCSWVVGSPAAVLAAEFFADTPDEASAKAGRAAAAMQAAGLGYAWPVLSGADSGKVWALRKAGLGLLMGLRQRARPVAVIEDSAVPVTALPDFARDVDRMMQTFGIDCVYYGHASVGLLHLRPALDLDAEGDREIFCSIAEKTARLVKHYRGSLSGEHGDGRVRAPYLREFLGDEVYALLQQVKQVFDPGGIFNPSKIISAQPIDDHLRRRPKIADQSIASGFDWSTEGGFDLVLERCNGSGTCRQRAGRGAMCPTFQATGEELYSTRGRANLLRMAFSQPGAAGLDDPALAEAMETCLGCKACKSECPSGVDITSMKSEYLYRRSQLRSSGLVRWLLSKQPALLSSFAAWPAPLRILSGALLRTPLAMRLAKLERKPPTPAPVALSRRIGAQSKAAKSAAGSFAGRTVLLLVDPYINHLEPEIGMAAVSVLKRLGYAPRLHFMDSSLRLLVSGGLLEEAKAGLRRVRDELAVPGNDPVIGLEPAELLLLRDEAALLMGDAWPADLITRCFLLDEFLMHEYTAGRLQNPLLHLSDRRVRVHPHCHERAAGSDAVLIRLLRKVFGLEPEAISTGCCGMGGSLGYRHRELSEQIFRNNVRLDPNDRVALPLLVSGTSCRKQFSDLANARPLHPAQYLETLLCS